MSTDCFTDVDEEHRQAGGEAAGTFQRPDPSAGRMGIGPRQHPSIACTVGSVGQMSEDSTGTGMVHSEVDAVAVWITSDDEVVLLCEHDHCGCHSIKGERGRHRPG